MIIMVGQTSLSLLVSNIHMFWPIILLLCTDCWWHLQRGNQRKQVSLVFKNKPQCPGHYALTQTTQTRAQCTISQVRGSAADSVYHQSSRTFLVFKMKNMTFELPGKENVSTVSMSPGMLLWLSCYKKTVFIAQIKIRFTRWE